MINIMYLVLTAMLALNVSAEVMNAFFTLDEGNKQTIDRVDSQLDNSVAALEELLEDPSKRRYQPIQPAIEETREQSAEFNTYVDELRNLLIDASGNENDEVDAGDFKDGHAGDLHYIKGKKNKDVTTRLLVDEERGEELKQRVLDTRQALIETYSGLLRNNQDSLQLGDEEIENKIQSIANSMPFNIDDETWQESSDKTSWSDFKFRQMPLAAVLPLLSQMQADLKASESSMVNDMINLAGGKTIVFDKFFPVVQADKSYVIGGEQIQAKISVGTYSSSLDPKNVRILAGDTPLEINPDGTADYAITGSGSGAKTVPLRVEVTNPLTGEVTQGAGEFTYEVGSRSVAVSADKMNVFYIGVDNPITVSAAGVSSNSVRVSGSGGGIQVRGRGSNYNVTVSRPNETARISVSGDGKSLGSFEFRVKRIPDPVARLSNKSNGIMGSGEFRAQGGVGAFLDNFDFEATCQVVGFEMIYQPRREDPRLVQNRGARFSGEASALVRQAKPGDTYYFRNVRGKCPGDGSVTRELNPMVFNIK